MKIKVQEIICADSSLVSSMFWNITEWSKVWNSIDKVTIDYDDGANQEFEMEVWRDGKIEKIRTIRFRSASNSIEFFTPLPPPMMVFHKGNWNFINKNPKSTLVICCREYDLLRRDGEKEKEYVNRKNNFQINFQKRLKNILLCFKNYFETD